MPQGNLDTLLASGVKLLDSTGGSYSPEIHSLFLSRLSKTSQAVKIRGKQKGKQALEGQT